MEAHKAMDGEMINTIVAAVTSLVGGVFGGVKIGKTSQVESVKSLIQDYINANNFNRGELIDIKVSLNETRQMHKECEDGRKELECQLDEVREKTLKMEKIIQTHIRLT